MVPVTIVTGASAGIGAELARVFARHGHTVALVARREDRLRSLAAEIQAGGAPPPLVLATDLAVRGSVTSLATALADRGFEPQYVVNNAGFGLAGYAAARDADVLLDMIDLNVRALTELSLAFVHALVRQHGGILNVASVAAFLPGPGQAVYYATKAYVLSFSEALHHELRPKGVRVTALCPGPVATEFQARARVTSQRVPLLEVSAARVAAEGYRGLMRGRRLVVPGLGNKAMAFMPRVLPRRWLLNAADRRARSRLIVPEPRT